MGRPPERSSGARRPACDFFGKTHRDLWCFVHWKLSLAGMKNVVPTPKRVWGFFFVLKKPQTTEPAGRKKMKTLSSFLLLMVLSLCNPWSGFGYEPLPVWYWQLLDEDRYLYRSDMEQLDWREIRRQRRLRSTANQEPKWLVLKVLGDRNDLSAAHAPDRSRLESALVVMRDPDGKIHELSGPQGEDGSISVPHDENLIGRYLLGAHVRLQEGTAGDESPPRIVHLCAKHLVAHFRDGGKQGSASVVFFDDAQRMPLEIGPVMDTAKSKYGGGTQSAHRAYEMMVKYRNTPLQDARVTVITEGSQWQKSYVTDATGKFEIMPTDDRYVQGDWQKYLYVAAHHDLETGEHYVATLPVVIYKNRPEWRSKAMGFAYWAIIGSTMSFLMVLGFVRRKNRQDRQTLIIFENHKIKRERP